MSRPVRITKQAIKRHHLHIEPAEADELANGVLFTSTSRPLITARGVVGETDTVLQLREISLKSAPQSKIKNFEVTLIAVPALSSVRFVICPLRPEPELAVAFGHIFASWINHTQDPHQIYYPPDSEDYLMYFRRVATHLPANWCLEGTGSHLHLFKLPAEEDSSKLEEAVRLVGELKYLLVPT